MKVNHLLYDLKYYFQKNKKIYLFFLFFFIFGIVIGSIIAFSSDSYLTLLSTKDKVFYDYVNGKVDFGKESAKLILSFIAFQTIIFLLNLNFYSGLLSYVLISYQSSLMFLSLVALISRYGFSGILTSLFLILPINVVLIGTNILFAGFCFKRSFLSLKMRRFSYGLDKQFWSVVLLFLICELIFSYLITFIFVVILRRRFFIIF